MSNEQNTIIAENLKELEAEKPTLGQLDALRLALKRTEALNIFDFSNGYELLSDITLAQLDRFKRLINNNQIISIKRMLYDLGFKTI